MATIDVTRHKKISKRGNTARDAGFLSNIGPTSAEAMMSPSCSPALQRQKVSPQDGDAGNDVTHQTIDAASREKMINGSINDLEN